jgi:hypothetical protein
MGVIYIGDRAVGKTHLAMELANPNSNYVRVINPEYEELKRILYDESSGATRPTEADSSVDDRLFEVEIQLRASKKQISVDWIDSPGEIWRAEWQNNNSQEWNKFLDAVRQSEGVFMILAPFREMLKPGVDPSNFVTKEQWRNRFNRWVDFFSQECPNVRHIVICLNKADLFCDIEEEAEKLGYDPNENSMNWYERHTYVFKKYFRPIHPQIEKINQTRSGLSIRCFITSIYNRSLLELPWVYLASYLD